MKHSSIIYIASAVVASGLLLGSCSDFLSEDSRGQTSTATFFKNELQARQALNGAYRNLGQSDVTGHQIKQIPTDLAKRATWDAGEGLANFTFGAENSSITTMWEGHYRVIKDCNSVIDNVAENAEHIDNAQRYIAQARGIRAYLYFDLVRWFGDVPLIITDTRSLDNLEQPRAPQAQVFKQIIDDLEYCIDHTMDKDDVDNGYQYGRMTTDAARGILAKVHLWLGSVAQRDGKDVFGTADDNYAQCLDLCTTIIQSGRYSLCAYYPDVFDAKTRDEAQKEVLFCTEGLTGDNTGSWVGMLFGIRGSQEYGGSWDNISSSDFHRMMYEPSDSVRRLWNCPRVQILEDGKLWGWDYKCYWDTRSDQKLSDATESNNWVQWSIGKFRRFPLADPGSYNYTNFGMDEPLLRYADILLMYAEAYNEVNHGPGTYRPLNGTQLDGSNITTAYDAVNLVRRRARISNKGIIHEDPLPRELDMIKANRYTQIVTDWRPNMLGYVYDGQRSTNAYYGYTDEYDAFRREILNERAREFVGETTDRWCDLVRRGILVDQMQQWRVYNPFVSATERGVTNPGAPENISEKHMLLPVPQSELDVNPKLTQNPGY